MIHLIYEIRNKLNSKIYVGAHSTEDENDSYMGSGVAIRYALKKYGKENFEKRILYRFDTANEMYEKEKEIVTLEFVNRSDVYNMGVGGKGNPLRGVGHSQKTITKISNSLKTVHKDPEYRNKFIESRRGRKKSDSERNKISNTLKTKYKNGEIILNRSSLSDERKSKVRKKVSIDGVVYPTQTIASRETGYSIAQIKYALKHNKNSDWFLL